MNLQDLYEKEVEKEVEKEEDSIDIRDPATKWLIKKARAKYAYAETDLEAFVQFMRDEVDAEKKNIQANTDNIDTEHDINIGQASDINSVEKINNNQERHLKHLDGVEKRLDAKEKQIDAKLDQFDNVKKDFDMKFAKMDKATLGNNTVQIGR